MAGKIIVYSPLEYMGVMKLYLYINGIDQGVKLKRSEKHEITIDRDVDIHGCVSGINSSKLHVSASSITEIQFVYRQMKGVLEIQKTKETPIANYVEKEIEKPVFEFDGGVGDRLTVFEDRIILKHKGVLNFFAMGINGDKVVYFTDITGIQFKPGGMTSGHLQFSILGGNESKGGILNAASDENTITFIAQKNREAQEIHDYLNNKLRELKTAKNTPIIQAAPVSAADELKKFKELLDMGVISQEEFDAKKK